jgi:hypothetical protein
MAYGRAIAPNADSIVQLTEGESDNDEMFWMILGDDDYARADYWKWRPFATEIDPRTWRVSIENRQAAVCVCFRVAVFTSSLLLVPKDFYGFFAVERDRFSDMRLRRGLRLGILRSRCEGCSRKESRDPACYLCCHGVSAFSPFKFRCDKRFLSEVVDTCC